MTKMSVKQRFGVAAFLTMNVWLIVIALVRATSLKQGDVSDTTWALFFQYFEPNIAILAACLSAFRSIFVTGGSKRNARKDWPSNSPSRRIFRKAPRPLDNLPRVPGATLTGIRTFIGGKTACNTQSTPTLRDSDLTTLATHESEPDNSTWNGRTRVQQD